MTRITWKWAAGVAAAQLSIAAGAQAAVITTSTTPPIPNGSDIFQLSGTTDPGGDLGHLWGDRPVQGQTFTTGSFVGGYLLDAFTLGNLGAQATPAAVWEGRVGTITGGGTTPTFTEIVENVTTAGPGAIAANSYVTFTLDTPVVLLPNTTYGFDLGVEGSGIVTANAADDTSYAGGSAYSMADDSDPPDTGTTTLRTFDRVFHVNLTQVPEPGSAAVVGVAALGLLARRRRQ